MLLHSINHSGAEAEKISCVLPSSSKATVLSHTTAPRAPSLTGEPISFKHGPPDADALMNPTKRLEDEEAGIFNEVLEASNQEEIIHENLRIKKRLPGSVFGGWFG